MSGMREVTSDVPSRVLAGIALFVALGGTGYAISTLPRDSVGTRQLKDGAVTTPKLSRPLRRAVGVRTTTEIVATSVPGEFCGAQVCEYPAGRTVEATAVCPMGSHATGGGFDTAAVQGEPTQVTTSEPTADGRGWRVVLTLTDTSPSLPGATARAVCVA